MSLDLTRLAFEHPEVADLEPAARRLALREMLVANGPTQASSAEFRRLSEDIDGFGCLTELMEDETVTDIFVNGPDEIWTERPEGLRREPGAFRDVEGLFDLIERLLASSGQRVDFSKPLADARLRDGSRIHVALPPVAPHGPLVSIRRFPKTRLRLDDLVSRHMLDREQAERLTAFVRARRTILISGGTGTGKTTLLNALLAAVPSDERVVLIEETPELAPDCPHHVSLVARASNQEGRGGVDLADLLRASLRMRPDRIVVGEIRGQEASVALSAMSTGHPGSLLTMHASSAEGAISRLVLLAQQAHPAGDTRSVVEQAIDVCVHLDRDGRRRRIAAIVER